MRSALIVALLVLAGCSHSERASVTIHALGPTGDTWYRPPQPIWRFAITNTGAYEVAWESSVQVRGGSDPDYSHAGGHIDWPEGILLPGQSVITNMIVPGKAGSLWRASVEFWPISPEELRKAQDDAARFGLSVFEFTPRHHRRRIYKDEWHH
jgi:hypothetical protein